MLQEEAWRDRVIDEKVAYNSKFQNRNDLILRIFCENIKSFWRLK